MLSPSLMVIAMAEIKNPAKFQSAEIYEVNGFPSGIAKRYCGGRTRTV
jgi:hypothetical protein